MQKRSEDTYERILKEASILFAKKGYAATSVAAICEKAQVSKGAFYHHFPSKQDVFLTLLDKWLAHIEDGLKKLQLQSKDVPTAIMLMADTVGSLMQETDVQLSLFLEFWTQAIRDPQIWDIAFAPYRRFQSYFSELVSEGVKENSLKNIDPELGGKVIVSLALGLIMMGIFEQTSINWKAHTTGSFNLLLNGIMRSVG